MNSITHCYYIQKILLILNFKYHFCPVFETDLICSSYLISRVSTTTTPVTSTPTTTGTSPTTTIPILRGDTSKNGKIELLDAIIIAKYLLGLWDINDLEMIIADYDENNMVNLHDAIGIAKYLFKNS